MLSCSMRVAGVCHQLGFEMMALASLAIAKDISCFCVALGQEKPADQMNRWRRQTTNMMFNDDLNQN